MAFLKKIKSITDLILDKEVGDSANSIEFANENGDVDSQLPEANSLLDLSIIKEDLKKNIESYKSIAQRRSISVDGIEDLFEQLSKKTFKIVVIGEFSRGKSTFVNSLLRTKILPSNNLPTTAVLTEVSYSEKPMVELHFKDGEIKNILPEELIDYTTNLKEIATENSAKIELAQVYYPSEICQLGCTIIDTPGVNDINDQNNQVTYNYIPKADAAIVLLNSTQAFTQSERDFLQQKVLTQDISKIFFVINKSDLVDDIQAIIPDVKRQISETTGEQNPRIYALSSKNALITRIKNINDGSDNDFVCFENALSEFLAEEKGKALLANSLIHFERKIDQDIDIIKAEFSLLNSSVDEIDQSINKFVGLKANLVSRKNEIYTSLQQEINEFRVRTKILVEEEHKKIANDCITQLKIYGSTEDPSDFVEKARFKWAENLGKFLEYETEKLIGLVKEFYEETAISISDFTNSLSVYDAESTANLSVGTGIRLNNNHAQLIGVGIATAAFFFTPVALPVALVVGLCGGGAIKGLWDRNVERKEAEQAQQIQSYCDRLAATSVTEIYEILDKRLKDISDHASKQFDEQLNNVEASLVRAKNERSSKSEGMNTLKTEINSDVSSMYAIKQICASYLKSLNFGGVI